MSKNAVENDRKFKQRLIVFYKENVFHSHIFMCLMQNFHRRLFCFDI
jgi:hypothetical protein